MVMEANRSVIRALEPIQAEIEELFKENQPHWQFRLDKRALNIVHLKAIARIYGDHGQQVLELFAGRIQRAQSLSSFAG